MASVDDGDDDRANAQTPSDAELSAAPRTADSLEALLGAVVHAPAETPALAIGDELAGRYRIAGLVGAGGMGAIYLATDRTLDRQVAIKLHHSTTGTARLRREAVAMARLANPNVIAVFEVGELPGADGQAFVAMEYVPGTTLRAWLGSAPRTVRERLAMLDGAGAGLAAAHDAGLIHRDIKPENILVGDDGRARVGDFGLARGAQSDELAAVDDADAATPPSPELGAMSSSLTRTGAVLGTPAYMAPEQAAGGAIDARADQFAFCVVGWELLFGERPFAGANLRELGEAITAGPRRPPPNTHVRPAIRRVLERGLAIDPAARYRDLHELRAALRRASRSRVVVGAIGGVVVAIGATIAVAFALHHHANAPPQPPSCDRAGAEIDTGLPRDLPARLRAIGGPFALDGATRVQASIDHFAARYRSTARAACRADTIDHTWSGDLGARSAVCLTLRRRTAAVLLSADDVRADDIPDLVLQAIQLPDLDACVDPASLAAAPIAPTDPAMFDAAVTARARLDAAHILTVLGRVAPARETLATVSASPAATQPAIAARLALIRGDILRVDDQILASEAAFREAYATARAIDDVEVTVAAIISLVHSTGTIREDRAAADEWIKTGLADALRARGEAPHGASALYAVISHALVAEDRVPEALEYARASVALVDGSPSMSLVDSLGALADASCAAGHYDDCLAAERRAIDLARSLLGPTHPTIGLELAAMALDLTDTNHHDEALALAKQAKVIVDASHDLSSVEVARTETTLASMIYNSSTETDLTEARAMMEDARARMVKSVGADHPDVAQIDADLALYDNVEHHSAAAIERLQRALAIIEHAIGPTSTRAADTLYNLAAILRDANRNADALAAAARCADINAHARPGSVYHARAVIMTAEIANLVGDHTRAETLATQALALPILHDTNFEHGWAAMEAGRALLDGHTNLARARALLDEARAVYVAIKSERVAEIDALLARLPR